MECEVCGKTVRIKNSVVCSEHCQEIRLKIFRLVEEYTPTKGCDNCWGDLHQGCSEECRREFKESLKFGTKLWSLVHFIFKLGIKEEI